jgi:dTDP-4-amino-4,6-dideoxygalactose transaminase
MEIMQEDDEIIVPANTYIASILAITDNRLKPVLVEPDINTYNIDINNIERHISSKTRAILIVHLYGRSCWSDQLLYLAQKYNLRIVEDNAQASGAYARYNEYTMDGGTKYILRRTGSLGDASGHSFYPGKNLGALGDGGAVTTDDPDLANVVRSLANYGSTRKYVNDYRGLNSRLDEIQAAVLKVKLPFLDMDNQRRREIAEYYISNFSNSEIIVSGNDLMKEINIASNLSHVWHIFPIRHPNRDDLQRYLSDNGIQTLIHYPIPPHKQLAYKEWNNIALPITEKIHNEVLSLPISQVMDDSEIEYVVRTINKYSAS